MKPIKVAVIGVGNCASSLVQGVAYYRSNNSSQGLIHDRIGGYGAGDVEFVMGVDVDARKVGKDIAEAIFAAPNGGVPRTVPGNGWVKAATVTNAGKTVKILLDGTATKSYRYFLVWITTLPPGQNSVALREIVLNKIETS